MIEKTRDTKQTDTQNICQHHLSVWKHTYLLLTEQLDSFKIPDWYHTYKTQIKQNLHSFKTIKHYCLHHDIGKSECLIIDSEGKRHYPDHANKSADMFLEHIRNDETIARLIRNDMAFHTLKFEEILDLKLSIQDTCTLLITALAELHSNAKMFGGMDSDSFKIKWKRLNKLGKKILHHTFDHPYVYAIVRKDLSVPQQAVQAGHALIESTKTFNKINEHPSVIICSVKNEKKLQDAITFLYDNNVKISVFKEPDINNQMTALATEPLYGVNRKIMNKFQLMRGC